MPLRPEVEVEQPHRLPPQPSAVAPEPSHPCLLEDPQDLAALGGVGSGSDSAVQEGQWACQERTAQVAGGNLDLGGTSPEALRTAAAYRMHRAVHQGLLGKDLDREESHLEDRTGSRMDRQGRQREGIRQGGTGHAVGTAVVAGRDR
jgi:hypothetical protein